MPPLYQKLKAIAAAQPHLLVACHRDLLVHDRRAIRRMTAGQRWIWILRTHGTHLFPVAVGQNPVWVTSELGEDTPTRCYLITVTAGGRDGEVAEVPWRQAVALAHEPAPKGMIVWQPSLFSTSIRQDGVEIAKIERTSDIVVARIGSDLLGRFTRWVDAVKAMEEKLGPASPMVCA